jgi:hypothetical protein
MSVTELYKEITAALDARNIPYMVSGSMAMLAYTVARTTRDIDIVIELSEKSLNSFYEIFKDQFYLHKPSVEEELHRKGMFNAIDNRSGLKIDFFVRKNSPFRKTEFERRTRQKLFGHEAWLVSIEDLILSKLIWIQEIQSDRQKEDVKSLLENKVDRAYLDKWIHELKLNTFEIL